MSAEILIRKDGSQSIAAQGTLGIDSSKIEHIVGEHLNLREDGFHTGQVSSGATLEGTAHAVDLRMDVDQLSDKLKAMNGMPSHFEKWRTVARKSGLYAVSSLSTAIELMDKNEGKEIKGAMGEALGNDKILLVANYHDEADLSEMNKYQRSQVQRGNLLRTESEENDFHAANIAIATGAAVLMLCTGTDKFVYKGKKLDNINVEDIPKFLRWLENTGTDNGAKIRKGGMKTKLGAAAHAIENGVRKVVIGDSSDDSRKILENNRGTWVVQ